MTTLRRLAGAVLLTLWLSTGALAESLTVADPVGAGFSPARLARIAPWYQAQIESGAFPGAVVAIARDQAGKVSGVVVNPGPQEVRGTKID